MKTTLLFGSAQRAHVDLAVPRPVELAEEDALVAPECKLALFERNEYLRAHKGCTHVRGSVRSVVVVVLPAPAVLDDLLHRRLDVVGKVGIDVLVDRHARGR